MKNPLLVPAFREMPAATNVAEPQNFCESNPPAVAADFLGALSSQEVWEILLAITSETHSLIFSSFDEDVSIAMLDVLQHDELVDVISNMPDEQRLIFIRELPRDIVEKLNSSLLAFQPAEAAPALSLVPGAAAPAGDAKALRDFCEAGHYSAVAEMISVLSGEEACAVTNHAEISSLMPGTLPKNTTHSLHPGRSRWHNHAVRRFAPC